MTKINHFAKVINISFILIFLSSCNNLNFNGSKFKNDLFNNSEKNLTDKDELEISISCEEGSIEKYLQNGWKINKEYSQEKICSWKAMPANSSCDMEKDKGCKIIVPDKLGVETFYLLEKIN